MKYKILDCTLRDGGYYNNWKFEKKLIDQYILAMSAADIDCIELGLRNFKLKKLLKGNNFFCTEEFISKFKFSKKMKLSVMINTSDIVKNHDSIEKTVKKLFLEKKNSRIDIVRIASHLG